MGSRGLRKHIVPKKKNHALSDIFQKFRNLVQNVHQNGNLLKKPMTKALNRDLWTMQKCLWGANSHARGGLMSNYDPPDPQWAAPGSQKSSIFGGFLVGRFFFLLFFTFCIFLYFFYFFLLFFTFLGSIFSLLFGKP